MFGLGYDQVVVIDRATGSTTHLFPHGQKEQLTLALAEGDVIEIKDAQGDHRYPPEAVLGLHFIASPNYSQCRVQLWESPAGLYLADPFDDQAGPKLWLIRSGWLSARTTFRTLAARLCEQSMRLPEVVWGAVSVSDVAQVKHVATWHQQGARVEVEEEAGERARSFIGTDDLTAQSRA